MCIWIKTLTFLVRKRCNGLSFNVQLFSYEKAGGELVNKDRVDVVGLWNPNTLVWTDLPRMALARSRMSCGYFK